MARPAYQRVAAKAEIGVGEMRCVEIDGRMLVICHVEEGFFAVDNTCSHADAKMSEGRLRGHRILCPLHGAAFDVRDGSVLRPPATQPIQSYPVRIEGDDVLVSVEG